MENQQYSAESNKNRGNRYTLDQKLQALMVYQANKFHLARTSQETGINEATIKHWMSRYGDELFGNALQAEIAGETNEMLAIMPVYQKEIDKNQAEFLRIAHEVKLKAVEKLQLKLKYTNNVATLVFIIKTLDRATNDARDVPASRLPAIKKQVNVFNKLHQQFQFTLPDDDAETTD